MQNLSGVSGVILGSTVCGFDLEQHHRLSQRYLLTNDHQLIVASQQQRQQQQRQQRHRQLEKEDQTTTTTTKDHTMTPQAVTSESSFASMSTTTTPGNGNARFSPQATHLATTSAAPPSSQPSLVAMAMAMPMPMPPNPTSIGDTMLIQQQQQQQQLQLQQQPRRPIIQQPIVAVPTTAGNDPSSTLLAIPIIPGMMAGVAGGFDATALGVGGVGMGGSSVPEFLYQLTKMLTDRSNRDIIEWSTGHVTHGGGPNSNRGNNNRIDNGDGGGRIEVHHPGRLEREVLSRYFRHSKYSSFQRQLNYFGFRKVAGKGKMSPCSYVNDLISTCDVRSILTMTRKKGAKEQRATLATGGSLDDDGNDVVVPQHNDTNNNDNDRKRRLDEMGSRDDVWLESMRRDRSRAFDDMAASVARNVVSGGTAMTTMTTTATATSNTIGRTTNDGISNHVTISNSDRPSTSGTNHHTSKSTKPISSSSLSTMTTASTAIVGGGVCERRYKVAVGKGVRHQLNGYLRPRFVDPIATAPVRPTSDDVRVAASTTTTAATTSSSVSSLRRPRGNNGTEDVSYLSHPAARIASSAPAPLFQFLDPYELGMSPKDIEDSLSQLKDNFALAAATSAGATITTGNKDLDCRGVDHGAPASTVTASDVSSRSSSLSSASSITGSDRGGGDDGVFPSSLTRRAARGGMLRPNDSLIDLAMLPVLDNPVSCSNGEDDGTSNNDYMATVFSRDDSISNFIAAGYGNGVECDIDATTTTTTGRTSGDDVGLGWGTGMGIGGDGNANTFGFINFQS